MKQARAREVKVAVVQRNGNEQVIKVQNLKKIDTVPKVNELAHFVKRCLRLLLV